MKIRTVELDEKGFLKIRKVIETLQVKAEIQEVSKQDEAKYDIKHTPAIIIDNIVISGFNNLSMNDIELVFKQFIET